MTRGIAHRAYRGGSPNRGRQAGVWLGVLALALHTLIPLGQGMTAPFPASGNPIPLVLCTANGAAPVPSGPGEPRPDPSSCPVCQARALGGTLVAVDAVAVAAPCWDGTALLSLPAGTRLTTWHSGQALPRGPPSVA